MFENKDEQMKSVFPGNEFNNNSLKRKQNEVGMNGVNIKKSLKDAPLTGKPIMDKAPPKTINMYPD